MTQWEFSHLPFEGHIKNDKIVCQNCGWSWKVQDGGDDLYVCHNCNSDNSAYYLDGNYSQFVDYDAIASSVGQIGGAVGDVSKAKASKTASMGDTGKEIYARCGKDKSKSWSKKKKAEYVACRDRVVAELDTQKSTQQKSKQEDTQFKRTAFLEAQKTQRTQYLIFAGIVLVAIAGFIYYKRNK